jgi:hypothetical protein
MSEETKKKYRVLKAVAISGIVQRGVIVELTETEATNVGIGEYLEEVSDEETASVQTEAAGEAVGTYEEDREDEGSEVEQESPEASGSAEAGTGGEEGAGN